MTASGKFCLKWNDFNYNIGSSFRSMREDPDFSDVTLACEGNTNIEAHKVILAASSKFFKAVLQQNNHPHPLIYMRGIKGNQLSDIIDYMYYGEANINVEDLNNFLAVAEELELKGLEGPDNKETKEAEPYGEQAQENTPFLVPKKNFIIRFLDWTTNLRKQQMKERQFMLLIFHEQEPTQHILN